MFTSGVCLPAVLARLVLLDNDGEHCLHPVRSPIAYRLCTEYPHTTGDRTCLGCMGDWHLPCGPARRPPHSQMLPHKGTQASTREVGHLTLFCRLCTCCLLTYCASWVRHTALGLLCLMSYVLSHFLGL